MNLYQCTLLFAGIIIAGYILALAHHRRGREFDVGVFLTGIGTVLIALGAIFAGANTSTILDKIGRVQQTSDKIEQAVEKLENEIDEIRKERVRFQIANFAANSPARNGTIAEKKVALHQLAKMINTIDGVHFNEAKIDGLVPKLMAEPSEHGKQSLLIEAIDFKEKSKKPANS